ncbi:Clr5 domain-containing protein [Apodospora peruviana]|uniref:Clr5 domain-containing protein n=1 Tax=Apodospora peruviana TaxID=516989 RepID=A0AAE0I0D2_9PEZI|nr:Clr5 domain-containing protein [Apodospora peruviana]
MTKAWDEHRGKIVGFYKEQNKPLHEVQRIMEKEYRFTASTRAYRSRFDKWGIRKYSCRKRRHSIANTDKTSASEDAADPDPDENISLMSGSGSPTMMPGGYYAPGICGGTTSPEALGSPVAFAKFEPRTHQYGERVRKPSHSGAVSPGSFTRDRHYQLQLEHQQQHLHMANAAASTDCYPSNHDSSTHEPLYHLSPRGGLIGAMPLAASPSDQSGGFSQVHCPTPMAYAYSFDHMVKAPRE